MKPRIKNAIKQYDLKFNKSGSRKGGIYISDYQEIIDLSTKDDKIDLFLLINNASRAFYMIGHRARKR